MVTLNSRNVWERNLCQCETCVCLSRGWGIWFINQWQGGKESCMGLVTTVRLKWCILLFFISSLPITSYFWLTRFLSGAGQSLKHPEGQLVPILCHLVIPGDAVGTQTLSGSAEYSTGETKAGCKRCLRTVSCLPLWAGWNLECVNTAVSGTWGNSKTAYLCWKHFQQRHRNML